MEHNEEHVEQQQDDSKENTGDYFTNLMFGSKHTTKNTEPASNTIEHQSDIDYFTIMEQLNDIMNSIDNLKPVLKEFEPIVNFFKKKI
ncbi:hypothetical protein [Metabacillus malikii]|uniref:Spore coat protein n=1 Tax=Metabacillus malikii TaxID=1504265 RepID=A0ABT9ZKI2_9BACI|nr:hypothetical protein [Metabacillus malikii]MDQ0232296.1 hypothetical protein [Metabacillus malikii]